MAYEVKSEWKKGTKMEETKIKGPSPSQGVTVVGKDEAVKVVTNPITTETEIEPDPLDDLDDEVDSMVVINLNGRYLRVDKLEWAPAGCKVYTSKRELEANTKEQLEKLYSFVKGTTEKKFPNKEIAVANVWDAFGKLPMFDPIKDEPAAKPKSTEVDLKKQKKRKMSVYVMKPETDASKKRVSDLAPQAKLCAEILRGHADTTKKTEFTEDEVRQLFEQNKGKLRTRQPAFRIFSYYRSHLIAADVLIQK